MNQVSYSPIGIITILTLRNFILDNEITKNDKLLLHPTNIDDIILEYRETFAQSIEMPYELLTVIIDEDHEGQVNLNQIKILRNFNNDMINSTFYNQDQPDDSFKYDTIYRCGWCGNVVTSDGSLFDPQTKSFKIKIIEKFERTIKQIDVDGKCCTSKYF